MKVSVILTLALAGCAAPTNLAEIAQIAELVVADQDPEYPFVRVEVFPVQGESGLYVAIRDTQTRWWGDFICFKVEAGHIVWIAGMPEEPDEQSILKVRGFRLPGFEGPVIEVFGETHMGNGSCYLYELRGGDLRLLLKTRAVDQNMDLHLIRDGHLTPTYRDLNRDGFLDVEFTGVIDEYSEEEKLLRSTPCRKVFLWARDEGRFVEARSQRQGFESYDRYGD